MALFIRDEPVDALAAQLQQVLNAPSKKEAVRIALQHELERANRRIPLRDRIARSQAMAGMVRDHPTAHDMKTFMDGMWHDL